MFSDQPSPAPAPEASITLEAPCKHKASSEFSRVSARITHASTAANAWHSSEPPPETSGPSSSSSRVRGICRSQLTALANCLATYHRCAKKAAFHADASTGLLAFSHG
ncbi:unnamed protein product [Cutaneotrichosporon oleaginosum]